MSCGNANKARVLHRTQELKDLSIHKIVFNSLFPLEKIAWLVAGSLAAADSKRHTHTQKKINIAGLLYGKKKRIIIITILHMSHRIQVNPI